MYINNQNKTYAIMLKSGKGLPKHVICTFAVIIK